MACKSSLNATIEKQFFSSQRTALKYSSVWQKPNFHSLDGTSTRAFHPRTGLPLLSSPVNVSFFSYFMLNACKVTVFEFQLKNICVVLLIPVEPIVASRGSRQTLSTAQAASDSVF